MLKVGFVVRPGFSLMNLAATSVFEFANLCAQRQLYDVRMYSEQGGLVSSPVGTSIETVAFDDADLDTFIIGGSPAIHATSPALHRFISRVAENARRVSSICTGAFALADAGMLRARRATTHWMFTEELRRHAVGARVVEDVLFVVDDSIWTAAGNSAGVDLALCMVEQDHGAKLALMVARVLVVDYQRSGRQPQRSALLEINPKTDRIQDVLAFVKANLRSPHSVQSLAKVAALGPRQFSRAFLAETGMTPAKAIERIRLEAARLMLEQSLHSVAEIASETGFGDEERMRRTFQRVLGNSPRSLRQHEVSARLSAATV